MATGSVFSIPFDFPRGAIRLILVGVLLLALFIWVLVAAISYFAVQEVRVPDLRGVDYERAYQELRELGLEVDSFSENVEGAAANTVTSQSPLPFVVVRQGRTVSIGINVPPEEVRVPNFVGMSYEQAERTLGDIGIVLGEVTREVDGAKAGRVISQTPAAGSILLSDGGVSLVVSRGPEEPEAAMPQLVGLQVVDAKKKLETLGFRRVEAVVTGLSFTRSGIVEAQSPSAETNLSYNSTVTLYYTLSDEGIVRVPNTTGQSLVNAQIAMRRAGLDAVWVEYRNDPNLPQGVIETQPAAYSYTLPNTPIRLTVNGPEGATTLAPIPVMPQAGMTSSFRVTPTDSSFGFFPDRTTITPTPRVAQPPPLPAGSRRIPISFNPANHGFLNGKAYSFKLVAIDEQGERTLIERDMAPGEALNTSVIVFGNAELQTYVDGFFLQAWNP